MCVWAGAWLVGWVNCHTVVILKSSLYLSPVFFLKNGPTRPLFRLFSVFSHKQTLQFLQQINLKIVHPVSGAWIRPHDLLNASRLP